MQFINQSKFTPVFAVLSLLLLHSLPVQASLVISLSSITANARYIGFGLDVLLTNSDLTSVTIGAFSFELGSSTGDINFTEANTASTSHPYIFAGDSLFGPTISTNFGQILDASDLYDVIRSGATISAGTTLALGHILFDVSGNNNSPYFDVTISGFPATSLSDPNGTDISINNSNNGPTDTVPEPGTLPLVMMGLLALTGMDQLKVNGKYRLPY